MMGQALKEIFWVDEELSKIKSQEDKGFCQLSSSTNARNGFNWSLTVCVIHQNGEKLSLNRRGDPSVYLKNATSLRGR